MVGAVIGALAYFDEVEPELFAVPDRPKQQGPRMVDLRRLAGSVVPAHGLIINSRGISAGGFGGRVFMWMRKLLGAVSVAGMIALGLFVYTEFTHAWQKRGLPTIPISALSALDEAAQQGRSSGSATTTGRGDVYQPGVRRESGAQRNLSLLNDYIG